MVCPKCGAVNHEQRYYCRHCKFILKTRSQSEVKLKTPTKIPNDYTTTIFQSPLREAKPSNLSTIPKTARKSFRGKQAPKKALPDISIEVIDTGSPYTEPARYPQPLKKPAVRPFRLYRLSQIGIGLIIVFALGFFFISRNNESASKLFTKANNLYRSQAYQKALIGYRRLIDRYPDNALVPLAQRKVNTLTALLLTQARQEDEIEQLADKAERAFKNHHYLMPTKDNVVLYTRQILAINPRDTRALALQDKIVAYYTRMAELAIQKKLYRSARRYYRNLLKIRPDNPIIQNEIKALEAVIQ